MIGADAAIVLLTGSLLLSLIIERIIEIGKAIYDVIEARRDGFAFWNQRAEILQARIHAALAANDREGRGNLRRARIRSTLNRLRPDGPGYAGTTAISAARLRRSWIRNVCKTISLALGMTVALFADINLFLLVEMHRTGLAAAEVSPSWLFGSGGVLLTGVAMGLGSGPLHRIIVALENAKQRREQMSARP